MCIIVKFLFTLWISKLTAFIVSSINKKRGTNISGKIATKLMPNFVAKFRKINRKKFN